MRLPTPKEIFDEIVKETPKFNAKSYNDDNACTFGIFRLFSKLGKSMGYTIVPKVSKKGEFMTFDLLWKEGEDIVLAMEHENVPRTDPIENEWRKLINLKAIMKVLISYKTDPDERNEWVQKARQLIKLNGLRLTNETYLLILASHGEGKTGQDPYIQYNGFVFDNLGNVLEEYHSSTISMRTKSLDK